MKKQEDWNQAALNRVASTQIQSTGSCSWWFDDAVKNMLPYWNGLLQPILHEHYRSYFIIPERQDKRQICWKILPSNRIKWKRPNPSQTCPLLWIVQATMQKTKTRNRRIIQQCSAANRSKDRLFFLIPEKVLEDVHAKFDFALDPKGLEFSSCIGWLISRTAWLKTIYKDLLKKYSPLNLPNPFDDYDTLLRETIIGNEARASVLSITQTSNPSIAMQQNNNNSNITNFNFLWIK